MGRKSNRNKNQNQNPKLANSPTNRDQKPKSSNPSSQFYEEEWKIPKVELNQRTIEGHGFCCGNTSFKFELDVYSLNNFSLYLLPADLEFKSDVFVKLYATLNGGELRSVSGRLSIIPKFELKFCDVLMIDASDCMRLRVQVIVLDDEIIETRTSELVTGIDWKLRNFRDFVVESMFEVKSPIITVGSSLVRICVVLKCVDGEKVEASFSRVDHHRGEAVLLLLAASIGDDIPQHLPASFAWRVPSDYHLPWMEDMIDVSRLLDARDGLLTDDGVLSVKLLVGIPDERLETAPSGLFDKCFTWRLRRLKHMKDLMDIFCQTGREIPSECTFFDPPTDENMVQLVLKPLDYETYEFRLVFLSGPKGSHCATYKLEIDSLPNIVQKAMEFDSQLARSEPISLTTSSSVVNVRAWVKLISKPDFDRIMLSDEVVRALKQKTSCNITLNL